MAQSSPGILPLNRPFSQQSDRGDSISVLALTSTNPAKHLTWKLRVELMMPYLSRSGISVDARRIPQDNRQRRILFDSLRGYDILWLHRHTFWPTELRQLMQTADHLVFDFDDPVGYRSEGLTKMSLSKWIRFRSVVRRSSAVLAATKGLVRLARAYNERVVSVPLCADPESHSLCVHRRLAHEPFRMLWLGNRSTFRYLEMFRPHLEAIGRACFNTELHVVGHSRMKLKDLQVWNHQWSPAAEAEHLRSCHLGLVPLSNDRWTRAKATLKPLQYMANGMPFLGPRVGNLFELALTGRNGILADSPDEWVSAVQAIRTNENIRMQMGSSGIDYVRRLHSPSHLAERIEAVFRVIIASSEASAVEPTPAGAALPSAGPCRRQRKSNAVPVHVDQLTR